MAFLTLRAKLRTFRRLGVARLEELADVRPFEGLPTLLRDGWKLRPFR